MSGRHAVPHAVPVMPRPAATARTRAARPRWSWGFHRAAAE